VLPSFLHSSKAFLLLSAVLALAVGPALAQLSQNSGINPNDTYAVFDLTVQGQGTLTLPQAIFNPVTQSTSTTLNLNVDVRHYHIEIGYDLNDQLVMNIFPTDSTADPTHSPYGGMSQVQLRNGKLTLFDETGTPIPITLPFDGPLPQPLALLGAIPGASVLQGLIISDVGTLAVSVGGTVQYSTETTTSPKTIGGYEYALGSQVQMAYISVPPSYDLSATQTLAYQQFSSVWVLTQSTMNASLYNTQSTDISQMTNILWSDNPAGNARRAAKATTPPAPPDFSYSSLTTPTLPGPATNVPSLELQIIGQGPTNLLYQHGLLSDARTWDRMDPWIQQDFPLAAVAKSNLRWSDPLTNQANDLITLLQGTGRGNFLAVGHSQGGLIVRDVAYRQFNLVNRVIANETPNNGAWITQFERAALAGAMTDLARILVSWGRGTPLTGAVSTLGNALVLGIPPITVLAFDAAIPATGDLRPGSEYLFNLNSRTESFTRVGVEAASRWRFVEWRLIGDGLCNPESACGGRAFYNYANGVYYGLHACRILALLFDQPGIYYRCAIAAFYMDLIDVYWYGYTSFGDSSDGMVQLGGQHYNNAYASHLIGQADSHRGATKSDKVRATLDYALQFNFNLVPRWCQTGSAWPASVSMPDVGGSGSFALSTGSPCPWTAVSSVPWITISSGGSGTASGTVGFSADINLSPVARTGAITVTGLGSTVSFTVTQAGIPAGAAIGSVTINGSEQGTEVEVTYWGCMVWWEPGACFEEGWVTEWQPVWDTGYVWITVNGHTNSVGYGEGSSAQSIVLALAAAINNDSSSFVRAGVMGTTVWLVSYATQGANYPFCSGSLYDNANFTEPSFSTTTSGPTLTGSS
jgi:pimeloyl-ACP methyl ester carboxylesterase